MLVLASVIMQFTCIASDTIIKNEEKIFGKLSVLGPTLLSPNPNHNQHTDVFVCVCWAVNRRHAKKNYYKYFQFIRVSGVRICGQPSRAPNFFKNFF
jgi:hypothetical protein